MKIDGNKLINGEKGEIELNGASSNNIQKKNTTNTYYINMYNGSNGADFSICICKP